MRYAALHNNHYDTIACYLAAGIKTTMSTVSTLMLSEALEAPEICEAQLRSNADLVREAGQRLRKLAPPFAATLARGSSDQAAAFAKHLLEVYAGVPTLSHSPSIGSLYRRTSASFRDVPLIAISQSGRSPDLIAAAEDAKRMGALVVVIVNDEESPLAALGDITIPVRAGRESSVAATKSFVATLVALTHLVAEWSEDDGLRQALPTIAPALRAAGAQDWSNALPHLRDANDLLVLGRGPTLPIAGEAALKLKETAGLYAEAFSVAEVAHGPMTLVKNGDPVLVFGPADVSSEGLKERLEDFAARGATVIAAGAAGDIGAASIVLPMESSRHPIVQAIGAIQSFYALANALSLARGRNPDSPPHLAKVTKTL
ncbi:glucosamine--fructose-6-phosphate aminotransferase (isomerizing) [Sphingomonas vulcanisoli]|uniref:Glucosamine--fructose-6-phosphate aminotransferase (Isomerizing) n=1 Tax=Sphingomonas vulcanisoli TaxID=1658060 RepID=A0ABX0TSF5_9SPHN|nr:SIS domain-containing protein [Sphingomonas vulcanisoli]NIJ06730.1 glucosamine--fructose-6-phosphate aminotransferase (isomerizing) [Sphingomonas vulcanisoli]